MQKINPYTTFEDLSSRQSGNNEKIYERRSYFRLNFLEIAFNSVKGTLLRQMQLRLNHATQLAYEAQLAGRSTLPAIHAYLKHYPIFIITLLSLTIYDLVARIWRTNTFQDSVEKIIRENHTQYPKPEHVAKWVEQQLQNLNTAAPQDHIEICRRIFHVLTFTHITVDLKDRPDLNTQKQLYQQLIAQAFTIHPFNPEKLNSAYGTAAWEEQKLEAAQALAYQLDQSDYDLTKEAKEAFYTENRAITRQFTINRQFNRLTDIPKTYYNITQNIIMFPIEIGLYLFTLGPHILLITLVLSICIGGLNIYLSNRKEKLRSQMDQSTERILQNEKTVGFDSDQAYTEAIIDNNQKNLDIKNIDISMDLVDKLFFNIFTILLMGVCAYFLFTGHYDLAMLMAQTTSATLAFSRITKYLGLYKNHNSLKQSIQSLSIYRAYQKGPTLSPEILEIAKPWTLEDKFLFYLPTLIILLGLIALPFPTLALPAMANATVLLKAFSIAWLSLALFFSQTKEEQVSSSVMSYVFITAGLIACAYYLTQPVALANGILLLCGHSNEILALYTSMTVLTIGLFDRYARAPMLSVLDQIATWSSQEIVGFCKLPVYASQACFEVIHQTVQAPKKA